MSKMTLFTPEEMADQLDKEDIEGKQFLHDPELNKLADKVIKENDIQLGPTQIDYLVVYPNISKTTAGRCKKSSRELRFYTGFHYIIQVSGELWEILTEKQKYILVLHELLHVRPEYDQKGKKWTFKLQPHDFEDFWIVYKKYGLNWLQEIRGEVDGLYELSDNERIKL